MAASMLVLCLLSGCVVTPKPLSHEDVKARADRDRKNLTMEQEPVTGPIDLYEAMARAMKYNLDARVGVMHKLLAETQLDLSHHSLLPKLVANTGYDGRNNYAGGRAQSLISGQQILEPFTSQDKNIFSADLNMSWNVLDFGLSYVRAQQASDDVLIAEQEKRRVAIRILQEIRSAYWRAVSAERTMAYLTFLETSIGQALETSKTVQKNKLDNPVSSLQYQLDLLGSQRIVQQLYRDLSTAKTQLAALMNIPPGQHFDLVVPNREEAVPVLERDIREMEDRALLHRPELRQLDYRKRINARETKAALLEMLPSLGLQFGGNYNSNTFLFYHNWLSYGARASWNLLNVFRQRSKLKTIEAQDKLLDTQSLAMSMAVLTQVHVSAAQVQYAKQELDTAKRFYDTQAQLADQTRLAWQAARLSDQALIRERVNHVLAQLRYDTVQAEAQAAWANLLAAIGEDPLPQTVTGHGVKSLATALRAQWESAKKGGRA
jgi:outer membrane protein, multidrug efflux system